MYRDPQIDDALDDMSSKPAGQTGGFFRIFITALNRRHRAWLARKSGLAQAVRAGAANVRPGESVVSPSVKQVTFGRRVRRYRWCRFEALCSIEDGTMKTRRMIYWWFWFVVSGRFLERFLNLRYDAFMAKALDNAATRCTGRRS
jgi:hypothetical protein